MNALTAAAISIPDVVGTPFAGGYYAGRYLEGDQLCLLIVSGKIGDFAPVRWNKNLKSVAGALSFFDGMSNTRAMAEAGSPLAQSVLSLDIDGETDWHLPARDQLELLYRHFKPTTRKNLGYRDGDNPSSVPPGYPYTDALPAITQVPAFASGGAEAFEEAWYWSSTQRAQDSACAWLQGFAGGYQDLSRKGGEYRARAVRRLKI
jgi:hypothetical protein